MSRPEFERISPVATRSRHTDVIAIDAATIEAKIDHARQSPRKRNIHAFQASDEEPLHRMLNAIQPGSYVRPHRHLDPPKAEGMVLLRGRLAYVSFDDDGQVQTDKCLLLDAASETIGVDIREGVWHTIFALAPDTVVYEVKPGPYRQATDKDFAAWAPPEGTDEARRYLVELEDRLRVFWHMGERAW